MQAMQPVILHVEDSPAVRASVRDLIAVNYPGCRLLEARDCSEGVAVAIAERPRLVLMDIRVGAGNGIEATRRIKTAVPEAQVVILTMCDGPEYRASAAAAGADGYVVKSRAHRELIPLMQRLLSETAAGDESEAE